MVELQGASTLGASLPRVQVFGVHNGLDGSGEGL